MNVIADGPKMDSLFLTLEMAKRLGQLDSEVTVHIQCEGVLELLTGEERVLCLNEMHRLLAPGGTVQIVVPYHSHPRAFAHPLIQWPPFSEHSFLFVDKEWRDGRPDRKVDGMTCDFQMGYSYDYDSKWATRSDDTLSFAIQHYNQVVVSLIVNLTKR